MPSFHLVAQAGCSCYALDMSLATEVGSSQKEALVNLELLLKHAWRRGFSFLFSGKDLVCTSSISVTSQAAQHCTSLRHDVVMSRQYVRFTKLTGMLTDCKHSEDVCTTARVQAEEQLRLMLQGHGGGHKLPLPFWERVDVQGAPDQAG